MPITGVGSWLPTFDEFLAHWNTANIALSPSELLLSGGFSIDDFQAARDEVGNALADVQAKDNVAQTAMGDRDIKRVVVHPRIVQFGPAIRGLLPGSRYVRSIPKVPQLRDAPGKWRERMNDMYNLWTTINTNTPAVVGFTPPLKLAGNYLVAGFVTDQNALENAFVALGAAEQNAQQARANRDEKFAFAYEKVKQYRQVVIASFAPDSPILATLPKLTPTPGSTPAPVSLSASWNEGTEMADLVWSASADPELDYYSIRYHPGPKYKASEEQTVDTVPAGTTEFSTDFGLPAEGSTAWFKVYVVTTTANEKGSNAVKVIRSG